MLTKGTGFARYSKGLCLFVAAIWLVLAGLSFTSGADNAMLNGFLWLAGAIAFAVSGLALGKNEAGAGESGASPDSAE